MSVDEFVDNKVLPEFRPIVAGIRSLMKECAPDAKEVMSYALPMYMQRSTLAWISPNKKGITLGFMRGASFEDRYGLLKGVGKHAKHIMIKNLNEVSRPALRYYIKQALTLDQR